MTTTMAPIAERAAPPAHPTLPDPALGLTWRGLGPDDAPALLEVIVAGQAQDRLPYRTNADEVAEMFEGDWKDNARDTLGGFDADGVLSAWSQVTTAPGDTTIVRAFVFGGVHPRLRGSGIGSAMVAWQTGRARQLLAASGKEVPGRIAAYVDDTAPDSAEVYRAAGYTPIRYYVEMQRALDVEVPARAAPDGVRIAPWTPERDEDVRLAHNETFADHWGSQPRTAAEWAQGRGQFAPTWSRVAVDEATGQVAGYVLSHRYEEDWPVLGHSSGYTDLLGVRRAWRGRGLGVALLAAAMQSYRDDGIEYAEIGVDTANPSGAHGMYASLGFTVFHSETMLTIEV